MAATCDWMVHSPVLMEKIMSKSATPPTDVVRELGDDELETVSGGYVFTDVMVESSSVASETIPSTAQRVFVAFADGRLPAA